MNYYYRIDGKYKYLKDYIVKFFSELLGKESTEIVKKENLPLNKLDFVIYSDNELIIGAEIKSHKESEKSPSSWYSYHKNTSGRIQPENTHLGIDKESNETKGFIAVIDGQIRDYASKLKLPSIWLIQEGIEFKNSIEKALKFLYLKNRISNSRIFIRDNLIFVKIQF
jgi:hypothetical protein